MKRVLVSGAGGFIGGHLVKRLKAEGHWVRGVDLKRHEYSLLPADQFLLGDLRDPQVAAHSVDGIEEVYQLAADMGGAGYIFTGEHDAVVMHNSASINLNVLECGRKAGVKAKIGNSCHKEEFRPEVGCAESARKRKLWKSSPKGKAPDGHLVLEGQTIKCSADASFTTASVTR